MPKPKEKHIERLLKGKKSGINIGSRNIPHHLYTYEKPVFERAIKYKYLVISEKDRVNLVNLWEKYCEVKQWNCIICTKYLNGTACVTKNSIEVFSGLLADAKIYAKEQCK